MLIDVLRRVDNPAARVFLRLAGSEPLVIGDIVLLEVLQGTSSDGRAQAVEGWLRAFGIVPMLDEALAVRAAGHCCPGRCSTACRSSGRSGSGRSP